MKVGELAEHLISEVQAWPGGIYANPQEDDITLVVVDIDRQEVQQAAAG